MLVTGAGRGIGAAIATLAAAEGANVVVNDRDVAPARGVVERITAEGGTAIAAVGDVSDWDSAGGVVGTAVEEFGRLDGLVNNAGTFSMALPQDQDPESLRHLLEVNVLGVAYPGLHAIRHMVARGTGSIVNITSSAMSGLPAMSAYGTSKGAVTSMTLGWALDLAGTGVRVNALSPIATTRMQETRMDFEGIAGEDRDTVRAERDVPPEFNAPMAVYLLSPGAHGVNGQVLQVERGNRIVLLGHAHPAGPGVPVEPGSLDDVERAFTAELGRRLQTIGLPAAERAVNA
ncbi:short-chain dehydrogenase [Actinoallomurus iriomotensis]|uniref:Short-chain dehydrogenase n=1 Tax=Actinoallomurus iriomotensis TaxID=478107 RepID=A0A9W6W3F6_9ACTN|nr:short-chain dehydrogenase [Actinoallomurus iriomotensis]